MYIYPVHQRYFVIFEENAHLIGKLPDDLERELIVQSYTRAKGLLDSYKLNNAMVEKHNYAAGLGPDILKSNYIPVVKNVESMLRAYTPMLKKAHAQVVALFNELRASLEKPLA